MPRSFSHPSPMSRRRLPGAVGATSLGAAPAACGGGSGSGGSSGPAKPVSRADIDTAMKTPAQLTFRTWVPDITEEVALFEKTYPALKIRVVNAGQGVTHHTKTRTALKAGSGAPDLAQIEYQAVPTFTITGSLLDLRPYGAAALKNTFVDWTWGQVSGPNGEVWAVPQDTGPMGMLYRKDMFDRTPPGSPRPGGRRSCRRRRAARGRRRMRLRHVPLPWRPRGLRPGPRRRHGPRDRAGDPGLSAVREGRPGQHPLGGDPALTGQRLRPVPHARLRRRRRTGQSPGGRPPRRGGRGTDLLPERPQAPGPRPGDRPALHARRDLEQLLPAPDHAQ